MIRTTCAACKTPLAHTAPRCGGCHTPYCGRDCQKQHWKAGHKKDCKKIELGGGAEQYYADKKCAEAVAVAVEECAADTQGQTCYICTEALHWKTREGLVRGCACRGTAGFVHVSCPAEQAKIWVAEAEENNLGKKAEDERFARWYSCSQCKQEYYGVTRCALGWACWKTYLGRSKGDWSQCLAMDQLANGLYAADRYEDALSVREVELSAMRRLGAPEESMLAVQGNLAATYGEVGRSEEAANSFRDVYFGTLKLYGEEEAETLRATNNYANSLFDLQRFKEGKILLRKPIAVARRVFGETDRNTLKIRSLYAQALYRDQDATLDDLREAVVTLENLDRTARRVLGGAHPTTVNIERALQMARAMLAARETPPTTSRT